MLADTESRLLGVSFLVNITMIGGPRDGYEFNSHSVFGEFNTIPIGIVVILDSGRAVEYDRDSKDHTIYRFVGYVRL